jgi:type I restriction enzyme S subunit
MLLDAHTAVPSLDPAAPLAMLLHHFDLIVQTPADVDKLDAAILQLAVEGKLVAQDPNDGTAITLVDPQTPTLLVLDEFDEDENEVNLEMSDLTDLFYPVPSNWIWSRIDQVSTVSGGKRLPKGSTLLTEPTPYIYVRVTDMKDGTISDGDLRYISEDVHHAIARYTISSTDLYITIAGTIGQTGMVPDRFDGVNLTENAAKISLISIDKHYLLLALQSPPVQEQFQRLVNKMAQPKLALKRIRNALIPLPPLAEQKRIVARVDELRRHTAALRAELAAAAQDAVTVNSAALNRLHTAEDAEAFDAAWQTLSDAFDPLYSVPQNLTALRQTILQLAVQGKLVPQDPNDEPATELIQRIEAEKERLHKAGKLRQLSKVEPVQPIDEHFLVPSHWAWARMELLTVKLGAGSTPRGGKNVYEESGIKFIRSQNVWNNGLRLADVAYISEEIHQQMSFSTVHPKDVLLNITGASIGRSAVVPEDFDEANVNQHVAIIRFVDPMIRSFVHICLISPAFQQLIMNVQVGISREGLSMTRLKDFAIPLPPLAEQERIVAKVDELLALCDVLEAELAEAEAVRVLLVDAVLAGV